MPKPRILVEALAAGNDSGLGRHVRLLVQALHGLSDRYDLHVLWPLAVEVMPLPGLHWHRVQPLSMRFWIECVLPWHRLRLRADALMHLGYTLPRWPSAVPSLLLAPDAGPLEETGPEGLRMSLHTTHNRIAMHQQIPRAHRLLVSTEFTAKRLQALAGIPVDRCVVLPPFGAYMRSWPTLSPADEKKFSDLRAQFKAGFIVCVGNVEPRKNHAGLLRAYHWLAGQKGFESIPDLVCIGHEAWGAEKMRALVRELQLEKRVHFTGHISDAWLGAYLREALFCVAPSLYEGFGMPLFEAMALGKACIYHRGTSHEEFAAGAALAVDATKPESLGQALSDFCFNEVLRKSYAEKALERTRQAMQFDLTLGLRQVLDALLLPAQPQ